MSERWEKILELGAEGGTIALYGQKEAGETWIYTKEVDESTLAEMTEDQGLSYFQSRGLTKVSSWEDAVQLMGQKLYFLRPLYVHSEFKLRVWQEISTNEERVRNINIWQRLCSIGEGSEADQTW